MSGPYECLMCRGLRVLYADDGDDATTRTIICPECNGTGELWLACVYHPPRPLSEEKMRWDDDGGSPIEPAFF